MSAWRVADARSRHTSGTPVTCEGKDRGHTEEELGYVCGVPESLTRHQRGVKWPADSAFCPSPEHRSLDTKYGGRSASDPHR